MKKSGKKSKLVESDELSVLTKQGVQRSMAMKATQLTTDEIDQVSGGYTPNPNGPFPAGPICRCPWPRPFPNGMIDFRTLSMIQMPIGRSFSLRNSFQ